MSRPTTDKKRRPRRAAPRILVANGVNLDLLGQRQPEIYGASTLAAIEAGLRQLAPTLARAAGFDALSLEFFQTNAEPELLARLGEGWDGVMINAGAWTHTSLALADRLVGLGLPYVEVHLSNLANREAFRHQSYLAPRAVGVVFGFGADSYAAGLLALCLRLQRG